MIRILSLALGAVLALAGVAAAEDFPSRPITIVAPFPPGGVADLTARPLVASMEKVLKATVFIANAAYFPSVNKVYARYFPNRPPARTFVAVGSWPLEFDIEIECVALA